MLQFGIGIGSIEVCKQTMSLHRAMSVFTTNEAPVALRIFCSAHAQGFIQGGGGMLPLGNCIIKIPF